MEKSVINWTNETPKKDGMYLILYSDGFVGCAYYCIIKDEDGSMRGGWHRVREELLVRWCFLTDVKPPKKYKKKVQKKSFWRILIDSLRAYYSQSTPR